MKHRKLLIASIIMIAIGSILWQIIGPVIALAGITSHYEGWWIFGRTVIDYTPTYWVGLILSILGLIITIGATVGLVLTCVLEVLDRGAEKK